MNAAPAQVTADLQPIFSRQQDIQDNQVIGGHLGQILSLLSIVGAIDTIAFMDEAGGYRAIETTLIFYNKNAHGQASS